MWTWDSTQIDFSQTCWTFDGYNGCAKSSGGPDGGADEVVLLFKRIYKMYEQMRIERIAKALDDLNNQRVFK